MPPMMSSKRLIGTRAAMVKALRRPDAPKRLALTVSRARPRRRLVTLPMARTAAARTTPLSSPMVAGGTGVTSPGGDSISNR